MNYYAQKRKEKLDALRNFIEKNQPVGSRKAKAKVMSTYGVTDQKAEEYIQVLKDSEDVKQTDKGLEMIEA